MTSFLLARRWLAAALVLALTFTGIVVANTPSSSAAQTIVFGVDAGVNASGSRLAPLLDLEQEVGREFGLVRVFERWDSQWGTGFHNEIENSDRIMLMSVRAKRTNGSVVSWRSIADAAVGSTLHNEMQTWIDRVDDFDGEVWFVFHHEPEGNGSLANGNATDFIDAWRRFHDEFGASGVTNVKFAWVMTYWSFATDPSDTKYAAKWYPGDAYVDYIGSDAYNWDFCRGGTTDPWTPLEDVIEPQRQFGLDHPDKQLILAEWASTEKDGDGGSAKHNWIDDAAELFQQPGWEQFAALSYFHVFDETYPDCPWPADSTTAALNAFTDMANEPFFGGAGDGTTTTTSSPTTTTATTTTSTTTTTVPTTTTPPPVTTTTRPPKGKPHRP